jgi:hypothetical protein
MYYTLEIFVATRKINKDVSMAVAMFAHLSISSRKGFLKSLERLWWNLTFKCALKVDSLFSFGPH